MELVVWFLDSLSIGGVDDEDESLSVLVVMSPERSDLVLATDIPDRERNVCVVNSVDVETETHNVQLSPVF